ncbi:MAG: hypothetical protein JWP90_653, partial [Mycetocola sp.]|nr:hypothetical protein [Mycetocola sp.]
SLTESQQVPPAYVSTDPLEPPPVGAGLGAGWWLLAVVVALLLMAIPYVGALFGLGILVGAFILHRRAKRRAPAAAHQIPSVAA